MKNTDIKTIWKTEVGKGFKPFSEKELNDMIVTSAKKSIRGLHPAWLIGLGFLVVVFLVWRIASETSITIPAISFLILLLVLLGGLSARLYSLYELNKDTPDMPVKEWIQHRINSIDKILRFRKRYGIILYILVIVCSSGIIWTNPSGVDSVIKYITLGVMILLAIWGMYAIEKKKVKKYREVRDYLERLYNGIGE